MNTKQKIQFTQIENIRLEALESVNRLTSAMPFSSSEQEALDCGYDTESHAGQTFIKFFELYYEGLDIEVGEDGFIV